MVLRGSELNPLHLEDLGLLGSLKAEHRPSSLKHRHLCCVCGVRGAGWRRVEEGGTPTLGLLRPAASGQLICSSIDASFIPGIKPKLRLCPFICFKLCVYCFFIDSFNKTELFVTHIHTVL